jgi:cephalosporin hydroxylase
MTTLTRRSPFTSHKVAAFDLCSPPVKVVPAKLRWRGRSGARGIDPARNVGLSEFEVDTWLLSSFVVAKLVPAVGVRPYPLNELMLMAAAVTRFRPTHIFEWGTHHGKSARVFHETCRWFGLETEIHSIDLPPSVHHVEQPGRHRGRYVRGIREVALHLGDGVTESLRILQDAGNAAPLFFVDGDHEYASVRRELESIFAHAPDAVMLLHDTFFQDERSGYNTGPYRAITEFCAARSSIRRLDTVTGLPGMTLVYPSTRLR